MKHCILMTVYKDVEQINRIIEFAPENFADDEKKKAAAEKRISMIKQAYQYFENYQYSQRMKL